jgi:hypothetical protein
MPVPTAPDVSLLNPQTDDRTSVFGVESSVTPSQGQIAEPNLPNFVAVRVVISILAIHRSNPALFRRAQTLALEGADGVSEIHVYPCDFMDDEVVARSDAGQQRVDAATFEILAGIARFVGIVGIVGIIDGIELVGVIELSGLSGFSGIGVLSRLGGLSVIGRLSVPSGLIELGVVVELIGLGHHRWRQW